MNFVEESLHISICKMLGLICHNVDDSHMLKLSRCLHNRCISCALLPYYRLKMRLCFEKFSLRECFPQRTKSLQRGFWHANAYKATWVWLTCTKLLYLPNAWTMHPTLNKTAMESHFRDAHILFRVHYNHRPKWPKQPIMWNFSLDIPKHRKIGHLMHFQLISLEHCSSSMSKLSWLGPTQLSPSVIPLPNCVYHYPLHFHSQSIHKIAHILLAS